VIWKDVLIIKNEEKNKNIVIYLTARMQALKIK